MLGWFTQIGGELLGIVRDGLNGWRQDRQQQREANAQIATAELTRDVAVINAQARAVEQGQANEHEWDMEAARQARTSWKDEWFTLLFSAPLVLCFFGEWGAKIVRDGFAAMQVIPDWYVAGVSAAVAFAFGIRHLVNLWRERR